MSWLCLHFDVRAVPRAQFAQWITSVRAGGGLLDSARYRALARQSINVPVATFGAVEPDLFGKIVTQQLAPGPGPRSVPAGATTAAPPGH